MNELIGFAAYNIWFCVLLVVCIIVLFISEANENGYIGLVCTLIFLGCNYFWWNVPLLKYITWFNVGMYLFIGFIFSLARTFFAARKESVRKYELRAHVLRWWSMWPISLVWWICKDLIVDLFDLVYSKIGSIYEWIFEIASPPADPGKKK